MSIREQVEAMEARSLGPRACLSRNSKGRRCEEEHDAMRPCFQRDRDRVVHSKAFRRMAGKTQVFLAPIGDHYRTRMTHSIEVSQVGCAIARALHLNTMLVEAIAMAGGTTDSAILRIIQVTRNRNDAARYEVPFKDITQGKAPAFMLEPGDIIFVDESAVR